MDAGVVSEIRSNWNDGLASWISGGEDMDILIGWKKGGWITAKHHVLQYAYFAFASMNPFVQKL